MKYTFAKDNRRYLILLFKWLSIRLVSWSPTKSLLAIVQCKLFRSLQIQIWNRIPCLGLSLYWKIFLVGRNKPLAPLLRFEISTVNCFFVLYFFLFLFFFIFHFLNWKESFHLVKFVRIGFFLSLLHALT